MQHDDIKDRLLDAALIHVAFDGWTEATFKAAVADAGIDPALARALCPRGAVDLALGFHARGDAMMLELLGASHLDGMRFRDKIALAVRLRLEAVPDREAVRRGVTLFAMPQYAADGAKAIWGTCDLIWNTLGDTSRDVNWYTKRATLSAVYSSTVLYWLGDDSPGHEATWAFLDRRIDDVMRFEGMKAKVRGNPLLKPLLAGPEWLAAQIHAPKDRRGDLPGSVGGAD
ncbi:COQ9 family protein [Antarcticimicrobium luteum]|uniref:COQ9 family protein n=1 Tax=Antarcticimicrobium luteum TaxID=2547397 RepID=A0A4R5UT94_9RHOB|nr:COQ9 family protein [Antarcticimicrobium luteum]TDK42352.1 COQ9 family protein [Antarcticimicrobium luteum]